MTSGTINIDRGLIHHPLVGAHNPKYFAAWVWLLCEAGWKDRRKMVNGTMIELQRGQVSHSLRFMAEALNWDKDGVSRFLNKLRNETMIATSSATGQNIITICNYNQYQSWKEYRATDSETDNETELRQECDRSATNYNTGSTPDESPDESVEDAPAKEKKVAKSKPKRRKRGTETPCPEDWGPDEKGREYARKHWTKAGRPDLDIADQIERFRNYHHKHDKRMVSWSACWRTWVGNAPAYTPRLRQSNGGGPGGANRSASEQMSDSGERVVERRARERGEDVGGGRPDDPGGEDGGEGNGPVIELFPDGQGQFS